MQEYNMFFHCYTREQQTAAQQYQLSNRSIYFEQNAEYTGLTGLKIEK